MVGGAKRTLRKDVGRASIPVRFRRPELEGVGGQQCGQGTVLADTEVVEHQVAHAPQRRPGPQQSAVSTSAALTTWQLVELPIELLR